MSRADSRGPARGPHLDARPREHSQRAARPQSRLLLLAFLVSSTAAFAAGPVLSPEDSAFLGEQARRIADRARLAPGAVSGKWRNATPYVIRVPGGNMGYPAFWIRDAVMMLGADLVPAGEVEGWIRLMASTVRDEDWRVHPGAIVPAYAVPDHINFDGRPTFYPGTYDSGVKQGGHPYGKFPPLDDQFYFIAAVHAHWRLSRSASLFRARLAAGSTAMELAELCERVYQAAPSGRDGLVVAGDVDSDNAKDWGFCDTVFKSGKLLFPSILKYNAATQLAALFAAAGERAKSGRYRAEALRLRKSISKTFRRNDGWLRSATLAGNQPDIWGTAFAVWSGAVDPSAAMAASRALATAYRARTSVRNGLVRQILTDDAANGGLWEKSVAPAGTYQNGGYWGVPAGWYIAALERSDPEAAREMAKEFVAFLRNVRSDGLSEAWEWVNPDTGKRNNPLYVATVVLPYISLLQAGLLPTPAAGLRSAPAECCVPGPLRIR